jgi:hypothetical protein
MRVDDERDDGRPEESNDLLAGFEQALRARAARPPETSPAAAAAAVRERLKSADRNVRITLPAWGWGLAAVALALALGTLGRLGEPRLAPEPPPQIALVASTTGGTTLRDGQVLIWLDERTPLYMNFAPPGGGSAPGGGS